MTSPGDILKFLASGIIACGAAGVCLTAFNEELPLTDRAPDSDRDLDVRLTVDYNLNQGENPAPCHDLLEKRMRSAGYEYVIIAEPAELGIVGVEVDDDHLAEALQTFKGVLRETKSPHQLLIEKY